MMKKINTQVVLFSQDHAVSLTPIADSRDVPSKRIVGVLGALLHRVMGCVHHDAVSSRTDDTSRHGYKRCFVQKTALFRPIG